MDLCKVIFNPCFLAAWQLFCYHQKMKYDVVGVLDGIKGRGKNLMDFQDKRSGDGHTN